MQLLRQADIGSRYTFGFVGALMTSYGLISYSRRVRLLSEPVARHLSYAGIAFAMYALFAGIISTPLLASFLPAPVELLRAVSAFAITYFIIRGLNIIDIETRRKTEQQVRAIAQAEKLTSLGQLAAGIAHEINNPLTNASLTIQTLRTRLQGSEAGQALMDKLDAVEKNIDKASVIARELLQFSRQKDSEFIPCNINRVIIGALTLLHYRLGSITVHNESGNVPDVMGDSVKLEQVFINVISNAVESMPMGGEIAIFSSYARETVQVRISDTGPGIPKEHLSRVFDPFFTTKDVGVGTGLGLSISYGIIRQHHGTIEITSETGKGTTVILSIPTEGRHAE